MRMTQKYIKDYLKANPLGVKVEFGSVDDMHNEDYIIVNYLNDRLIGYNNKGMYSTSIQFTIFTKDFDDRKTLVDYVKQKFNVSVDYEPSNEYQYYQATLETNIMLAKDEEVQVA